MTGALLMAAFMMLTLLNGFMAGGKFGLRASEAWTPVVGWPWIPLPAWLVIATALLAPIAVARMFPHLTRDNLPDLAYLGMMTVVLYVTLPLLYGGLYTDITGLNMGFDSSPEEGIGWHWIGAAIQSVTLLLLAVGAVIASRRASDPQSQAL